MTLVIVLTEAFIKKKQPHIIIIINTRFTTIQFEYRYLNSTKFNGTGCITDMEVNRILLI